MMKSFDELAKAGYDAYCKQAGGRTFDGKPLPAYAQLGSERQACWVAATKEVVAHYAAVH